jgi:secreted trypsin-like serine protease
MIMNTFMLYIQDFNVGASSTMNAPFVQGGYTNVTMPQFNLFANPTAMEGGYTSLLIGVDQDATMQAAVRKLHFDESM